MFSWIWRKLFGSNHIYHPKERLIYTYWNGEKLVQADPLSLFKKVMEKGQEISVDIKVSRSISKDAVKAHDSMVSSMRKIFNVKSMEEGGLTEIQVMDLFDDFLTFADNIKKNLKTLATPATETSAPSEAFWGGVQPTPNSSDSGSVGNVPSSEPQVSLPSEQA